MMFPLSDAAIDVNARGRSHDPSFVEWESISFNISFNWDRVKTVSHISGVLLRASRLLSTLTRAGTREEWNMRYERCCVEYRRKRHSSSILPSIMRNLSSFSPQYSLDYFTSSSKFTDFMKNYSVGNHYYSTILKILKYIIINSMLYCSLLTKLIAKAKKFK